MSEMKYDLDRLASPTETNLRRGRGISTSGIVTMISKQEFHGEDIIIYSGSRSDIDFHSRMVVENARKMGFNASQVRFDEVKIDGRRVSYLLLQHKDQLKALHRSDEKLNELFYFLSSVTHEFCDRDFYFSYKAN